MIKCEILDTGIVSTEMTGPAAYVNVEFIYILKAWAEQMEQSTNASRYVHIWNACMVALGEDMTDDDCLTVAQATEANSFYIPKRGDGLPIGLWYMFVQSRNS